MAKGAKSNTTIIDGENIKIPQEAADLARLVKKKTKIPIGHYAAEAIKEKTRRDHPELINKSSQPKI